MTNTKRMFECKYFSDTQESNINKALNEFLNQPRGFKINPISIARTVETRPISRTPSIVVETFHHLMMIYELVPIPEATVSV